MYKTPWRKIAAHYAMTPSGLIPWAVVTIGADGTILSVESHEEIDSHYGVEFYSGILIPATEELKMFPGVPLEELLARATVNGAEALGVAGKYGSIETGKAPGIALLEGIDWRDMTLLPDASIRRLV